MKKLLLICLSSLAIASSAAFAHHAAADIVDDEIYAMIETLVADTPHADMTLEDLGASMTTATITTPTVTQTENLIDDGLLDYASMLDGTTSVNITFNSDGTTTTTLTTTP